MRHCRLIVLLAGWSATAVLAAPPTYRVVLLPLPADKSQSTASSVNDAGDTVGTVYDGVTYRGAVWPRGAAAPRLLGPLPQGDSAANMTPTDIDPAGFVVGAIAPTSAAVGGAVLWTPSGDASLLADFQPGSVSTAYKINSSGKVVGSVVTPQHMLRAFAWTASTGLDSLRVAVPGVSGRRSPYAFGINASGTIVGQLGYSQGQIYGQLAWVMAPGGKVSTIPGARQGELMTARAINASGLVAGTEGHGAGANAYVWSAETGYQALPTLSASTSQEATDLNDVNQVLGSWTRTRADGGTDYRSFWWSATDGIFDLAALIDNADPLKDVAGGKMYVFKINASGVVAVTLDLSNDAQPKQRAALLIPAD